MSKKPNISDTDVGDSATLLLDGAGGNIVADSNSIKYIPGPNTDIIQKLGKIEERLARIEQSLEKPKTKVPEFG